MHTNDDGLQQLEERLRTMLPDEYQDTYESVQPVSMGSASLVYGPDGRVAWDEIWGSFCDLAMAGGPPHKGTLLEPAARAEVNARPIVHGQVCAEICRGIELVTGLRGQRSTVPGWVRIACPSTEMAGWLMRAIVMENVSAHAEGRALDLPAGPHFRLEKEVKNVVTSVAKTCHYWEGHIPPAQQRAIAALFADPTGAWPLIEPTHTRDTLHVEKTQRLADRLATAIAQSTGLARTPHTAVGWLGLECPGVRPAVWMMRALVASNILSRREGTTLFVPVHPLRDPDGAIVAAAVARIHGYARTRGVVE